MITEPANLYSIIEFGRRNKVSRSTIYEMINDGRLEITKRGTKTFISAEQEKDYLESLPTGGSELLNRSYQALSTAAGEA